MNKKIKPNTYKPEVREDAALRSDSGTGVDFCLKCIMTVAFISILSLSSIFIYDFVTQSSFFAVKQIDITGNKRVTEKDILEIADLTGASNIFGINRYSIEKRIISHPWIATATVKRHFLTRLSIEVTEQEPLAIVKIENLADILINTQGRPFKEYNPQKDHIGNLPVISGVDLTNENNQYMFNGPLFNSIMHFLKTDAAGGVRKVMGDEQTGITIEAKDIYNRTEEEEPGILEIKLGFDRFDDKLTKARQICEYIDKNFPERTICAMDLFSLEKVFIKTKLTDAQYNNLKKGV